MGPAEYDRWKCREFVHRALQVIGEDQLPLFWYYLAFDNPDALRVLQDLPDEIQALRNEWQRMTTVERQDVLYHFVLIMQRIAENAVTHIKPLPRKVPEDDDPE